MFRGKRTLCVFLFCRRTINFSSWNIVAYLYSLSNAVLAYPAKYQILNAPSKEIGTEAVRSRNLYPFQFLPAIKNTYRENI